MLVYPDGCFTAGYPIHLGVVTDSKEVLAFAPDQDPSDDHFANAGHAILGKGLPTAVGHVPGCRHL